MMNCRNLTRSLLATTMLCGFAGTAFAQDAEQPPTQTGPIEGAVGTEEAQVDATGDNQPEQGITVTGTRIRQPNLTSASPVTVVGRDEVLQQGTTRTEDLLNSLPQSFAAQGSNISNGSTGTATVNLRGLGSNRTLVLVNGRRLMPGDPRSPVADINFVPALAIQRVDVLTGGASSVYGADAVAGVVNFIMDTNFEGIRFDAQYSLFNHDNDPLPDVAAANKARNFPVRQGIATDGATFDVAGTIGVSFDDNRGHITAYATYREQDAVLQANRSYSSCALTALNATQAQTLGRNFNCGGSATSANGTIFTNTSTLQIGPNRTFIPGSTPFNFGPINYFQRPDERYTFGVFADYEITDSIEAYLEAMFMDDRSVAQIAPSGIFFNTSSINCDNPLLSAQQRAIVCAPNNLVDNNGDGAPDIFIDQNGNPYTQGVALIGRRNVEGGGRQDDLQHTDYRLVAGLRGDFARGLSYDTYYQFGRVVFAQTYLNDFSVTRSARALDVVTGPNGQPVCRSTLNGQDPNCVPYDIFALNSVSAAALAYLQTPGFSRGIVDETVLSGSVTAELGEYGFQSPLATSGVAINVGAEYRKERLEFNTDQAFSTGDLAGQGGATIGLSGEFDVRELFGEIQIPLASDRPFLEQLEIRAGYRYSSYNVLDNSFNTDTYKVEGEWAPINDIRFRGSYNRAVRAPNIVELFSAQSVGLAGSTDPCAGAAVGGLVNGFTAAQCARTGVSAAQFGNIIANPAEQYNGFLGGNPDLSPEVADSYTAGVVIQPSFLPRFALTVDYFDIQVANTIGTIGADVIINQCVQTADPFFCSRVQRDQFGSLFLTPNGFIRDLNSNVGGLGTRGVDVNASYNLPIGRFGRLAFSFVGTWLDSLRISPLEGIEYDCAGFFGSQCGTPNPEWRHKARVTFTTPEGVGLSAQWRYFSGVDNDQLSADTDWPTRASTSRARDGSTSRATSTWCSPRGLATITSSGSAPTTSSTRRRRSWSPRLRSGTATPIRRCTTRWAATSSRASR
jgi:iron complex outermembrane receptor protein